jgi:hypothetical protein
VHLPKTTRKERIDLVVVNDAGEKGVEIENFGGLLELLESQSDEYDFAYLGIGFWRGILM